MEKENTFDLQLFGNVSNPYTFTLDGDYNVSSTIEPDLVDLSYYARDNIENYDIITEIPQEHLDYLQSGLHASNIENMFYNCKKLTTIPKLNIDTSKVTNMTYMFDNCYDLISLDLSNFNTSNVIDMIGIFYNCSDLTSLNLSNWDTSNVKYMNYMFDNCYELISLDLSNFNTNNVNNMGSMFGYCESLISLNISNWDTSNVKYMGHMFYHCKNLTTITGIIDMKSCTSYADMFADCTKLTGVKIKNPPSGFDGAGLNSSQYTIVS